MNDSDKTQILVALINAGKIDLPYQRVVNDAISKYGKMPLTALLNKQIGDKAIEAHNKLIEEAAELDAYYLSRLYDALGKESEFHDINAFNFPMTLDVFLELVEKLQKGN